MSITAVVGKAGLSADGNGGDNGATCLAVGIELGNGRPGAGERLWPRAGEKTLPGAEVRVSPGAGERAWPGVWEEAWQGAELWANPGAGERVWLLMGLNI